jgi:phosphoribosylformylglycinamidine synthase
MSIAQKAQAVLRRIEVAPARPELDAHGAAILKDIHELGLPAVQHVASSHLYLLEGELSRSEAARIGSELLADPVTERLHVEQGGDDRSLPGAGFDACVEVHLKGGVMDVVAGSTLSAIADMRIATEHLAAATARLYRIKGVKSIDELEFIARRLLFNDCIEDVYLTGFGRHDPRPERLPVAPTRAFELRHVAIRNLDADALKRLSRDAHLFLSVDEMRGVQNHYRDLGRDPTDLELEMLAQTWSEHCVHKTLKSAVRYVGTAIPDPEPAKRQDGREVVVEYENLLRDTIARATNELIKSGKASWCLSVFKDNAGVIEFDRDYAVAFKVETHNHPSAIEPYGGAATGIGGCIRDVMGCGLGAKPIANTDVFCVGRPDFPMDSLPKGVLHPRRVLKGIVAGVRDYGNRMGIPTVNGAVAFDDRYLGNPLVFCGCVGLMPNWTIEKDPHPGDLVVVLGGRTGRDGIHGATFSSAELTDTHADEFSHAVQIGNAITEKQVLDAMLRMRNDSQPGSCLYTATTDCGAGGLSSAVGEMAEKLGADVELDNVPLKYAGLRYDEIWISEAQERMVISVPPANWPEVKRICDAEGVEATVIGTFRNDGRLIIRYAGQVVGDIDTAFLHGGIPKTRREATWSKAAQKEAGPRASRLLAFGQEGVKKVWPPGSWAKDELLHRLSQLDTASKEWIFRQYDHEVQGGSVVKPLSGPGEGPSDAAVLRPRFSSNKGLVLANGICPAGPGDDPYWTSVAAIDEAIRNVVCVGGNPNRTAILDNFCWGNCENPETMGALVRACQACYDAATTYGVPFISGKDSLNNEFALDPADAERLAKRVSLANNRIRIPETLLISAMSVIDDVSKCITMDAKVLAGKQTSFYLLGLAAEQWERVKLKQAAGLHQSVAALINAGQLLAVHDCGGEGTMVALAEMAFAGRCGVNAWTVEKGELVDPFAAVPCGYLVQVADDRALAELAQGTQSKGILVRRIGQSRDDDRFVWHKSQGGEQVFEVALDALSQAWRSPLDW